MKAITNDKTSADKNSTAKSITYPIGKKNAKGEDEIAPLKTKEQVEIDLVYSEKQLGEKGIKMAKAFREFQELETEKSRVTKEWNDKIVAKETEVETYQKQLEAGKETLLVTAEVHRNFTTGKREYHYQGKKVREEKLRATDHQLEMQLAESKNNPKTSGLNEVKMEAGTFWVTNKDTIVEITKDDIINGVKSSQFKRLATQDEIDSFVAKNKKKK